MQIRDSFIIRAPREKVWDFLFDITKLAQCVPGVESVEKIDDHTYRGRLALRVGPIKSEFGGTVVLTQVEAPNRISGVVEGDDRSSASSVKAGFTGTLAEVEAGTQAAFLLDVNLRGRLAQFGGPVITATAKKLTADFARNLQAQLEH